MKTLRSFWSFVALAAATLVAGFYLTTTPGCASAPVDRVALDTLNTVDTAANIAYQAWVVNFTTRFNAVNKTNTPAIAALLDERVQVSSYLTKYQSAHLTATTAAANAIASGATNLTQILAITPDLSSAFQSLTNALHVINP